MKLPRMSATFVVAILLALVIAAVAPQQLPVTLYKLSLISIAGVAGYYLDRELFPYGRPDRFEADVAKGMGFEFSVAMLRRAIVVAACIIGVGLGA